MAWFCSLTRWMNFKSFSNCKRNSMLNSLLFMLLSWNLLTPELLSQPELKYLSMEGHFCVLLGMQFLGMFLCIFFTESETFQKKKFLLLLNILFISSPHEEKWEVKSLMSLHGSPTVVRYHREVQGRSRQGCW